MNSTAKRKKMKMRGTRRQKDKKRTKKRKKV